MGILLARAAMTLANVTLVWPFFVAQGLFESVKVPTTCTPAPTITSLAVSPSIVAVIVVMSAVRFAMSLDVELHASLCLPTTVRVVGACSAQPEANVQVVVNQPTAVPENSVDCAHAK